MVIIVIMEMRVTTTGNARHYLQHLPGSSRLWHWQWCQTHCQRGNKNP